jgi:MYXO-CTERM domain-containing protein
MHRARKRLVTTLATLTTLAAVLAPAPAWAFHAGSTFDKPPGAGGAGGIYYAGSKLSHGWNCRMCHEGASGPMTMLLTVDPPELFSKFEYVPGQAYTFTATMKGEHLGVDVPLANYNSIVAEIVDDKNNYSIGSMGGFAAEELYSPYPSAVISSGQKPNQTSWKFTWTAKNPDDLMPVHGPVTLFLAAVDGDAAHSPGLTLTDPFNDDVFTGSVQLKEAPGTMGRSEPSRPGTLVCALGLAALGMRRRRKQPASPALKSITTIN